MNKAFRTYHLSLLLRLCAAVALVATGGFGQLAYACGAGMDCATGCGACANCDAGGGCCAGDAAATTCCSMDTATTCCSAGNTQHAGLSASNCPCSVSVPTQPALPVSQPAQATATQATHFQPLFALAALTSALPLDVVAPHGVRSHLPLPTPPSLAALCKLRC